MTTGRAKVVRFRRRKQKRNPRRPLEAVAQDWARWDAAAKEMGINWSEFVRRAQDAFILAQLSEKPGVKTEPEARAKPAAKRAARKG